MKKLEIIIRPSKFEEVKQQLTAIGINGMNYSTLMNGLNKAGVDLNRKMLSEIAINDAAAFTALCEKAKAAL